MKKKNNYDLHVEQQIKKLEKSIKKYGDPNGTAAEKIKELKKL